MFVKNIGLGEALRVYRNMNHVSTRGRIAL